MKGVGFSLIIVFSVVMFGCATGSKPTSTGPSQKASTYYQKGVSLSREGKYEEGLKALKKAVRLYPQYGNAYYNMGIVYYELDRVREAVEAYQKAIEIKPGDAAAHNNLGNVYLRQGQLSAAIVELEQAVRIDPNYGRAHHNLALAYYLARMYHRAQDHLDELKRLGISPEADLVEAVDAALSFEEGTVREKR